jgi:hypothetical protein
VSMLAGAKESAGFNPDSPVVIGAGRKRKKYLLGPQLQVRVSCFLLQSLPTCD